MTSEETAPPPGDRDAEVTAAYARLWRRLARGLGSAVGLLSIAYVVGWMRASGFFFALGVPWMMDDLQLLFIIRLAWLPFLFVAASLYLTFAEAARGYARSKDEVIVRGAVLAVYLLSWCLALVGLFGGWWGLAEESMASVVFTAALLAGNQLADTAIASKADGFRWTSRALRPLAIMSYTALIGTPYLLGFCEGKKAADPATSTLPYVVVANSTEPWRLFHAEGDRLYVGILRQKAPPLLRIVSAKDATAVDPRVRTPSPSPPSRRATPRP